MQFGNGFLKVRELQPESCYEDLPDPFDNIRLLHLLPASSDGDQIECTLEVVCLSDNPKYEALSYVWGDEDDYGHHVLLNEVIREVRRNLSDALNALRRGRTTERVLWIDALCINQDDAQERGHQVRMMRQVYSQTECTIAWLNDPRRSCATAEPGDYDVASQEELGDAVEMIKLIAEQCQWMDELLRAPKVWFKPDVGVRMMRVQKLFNNPYWRRIWIFQEILLPVRVTIQTRWSSCTWAALVQVYRVSDALAWRKLSKPPPLSHLWNITSTHAVGHCRFYGKFSKNSTPYPAAKDDRDVGGNLSYLLSTTKDCFCSDPRDKLYAILGLVHPNLRQSVNIDYTSSLLEFYRDAIQGFMTAYPSSSAVVLFSEALQESLHSPLDAASGPRTLNLSTDTSSDDVLLINVQGKIIDVILQEGLYLCRPECPGPSRKLKSQETGLEKIPSLDPKTLTRSSINGKVLTSIPRDNPQQNNNWSISKSEIEIVSISYLKDEENGIGFGVGMGPIREGDLVCRLSESDNYVVLTPVPETESYRVSGQVIAMRYNKTKTTGYWKARSESKNWLDSDYHLDREVQLQLSTHDLFLLTAPWMVERTYEGDLARLSLLLRDEYEALHLHSPKVSSWRSQEHRISSSYRCSFCDDGPWIRNAPARDQSR